jgi:hypothetical protein
MRDASPDEFATAFRHDLYRYLEYSFEADPRMVGWMTTGDATFRDRALAFARRIPFAQDWARAVTEFTDKNRPANCFFRVDWRHDAAVALSLYCRFASSKHRPKQGGFVPQADPLRWRGPAPELVADALGMSMPQGIGLRVDASGAYHSALYFDVHRKTAEFRTQYLSRLMGACGYPDHVAREIAYDMPRVYAGPEVGVLAVTSGEVERAGALKLDPGPVPLGWAVAFIRRRNAAAPRVGELLRFAHSLRNSHPSYLGLTYGKSGFVSWKLYWKAQSRFDSRKQIGGA